MTAIWMDYFTACTLNWIAWAISKKGGWFESNETPLDTPLYVHAWWQYGISASMPWRQCVVNVGNVLSALILIQNVAPLVVDRSSQPGWGGVPNPWTFSTLLQRNIPTNNWFTSSLSHCSDLLEILVYSQWNAFFKLDTMFFLYWGLGFVCIH